MANPEIAIGVTEPQEGNFNKLSRKAISQILVHTHPKRIPDIPFKL